MTQGAFNRTRLYVCEQLTSGMTIALDRRQADYLSNVLHIKSGDELSVFNGVDGQWRAKMESSGLKKAKLVAIELILPQPKANDLHYVFAPLKQTRQDYMIQKAVEMGVSALVPVVTQLSRVHIVSEKRMLANSIEATEQCEILTLPEIYPLGSLEDYLTNIDTARQVIFCDGGAASCSPLEALKLLPNAHWLC